MRINKKQIAHALGIDSDDLSSKDMAIALLNIESILDSVAENLDDDFESAALGDASNLIQMIREALTLIIKNDIIQHMKCKKCGRWINDFHDRRCPARSDSGDNRVRENECKEEKMNWHYGQPTEEKEYLCCVRGISKPTVLDWLGTKKGWRKAVGINWLLFDNTRVVCYIGFDEIPMPENW